MVMFITEHQQRLFGSVSDIVLSDVLRKSKLHRAVSTCDLQQLQLLLQQLQLGELSSVIIQGGDHGCQGVLQPAVTGPPLPLDGDSGLGVSSSTDTHRATYVTSPLSGPVVFSSVGGVLLCTSISMSVMEIPEVGDTPPPDWTALSVSTMPSALLSLMWLRERNTGPSSHGPAPADMGPAPAAMGQLWLRVSLKMSISGQCCRRLRLRAETVGPQQEDRGQQQLHFHSKP
ncbi:hypothetical protein F7725_022248 [Dissostichus mawsoni]|uniref:Uncharacterized protein n=1 Tax=Dissostichus mawsoni TaxID=36200 RepID=A0A7J5YYA9_DISMA|nr:hypothetical protein F7725_022248 [Dissostichus mawsoni]